MGWNNPDAGCSVMGETDFLPVSKNQTYWFIVIDLEFSRIISAYPIISCLFCIVSRKTAASINWFIVIDLEFSRIISELSLLTPSFYASSVLSAGKPLRPRIFTTCLLL